MVHNMRERDYLRVLGKRITDSSARMKIVEEYAAHIEDCKSALMETGMSELEAEEEAVRQMGSPKEAGEAMDRIYHNAVDYRMLIWMLALGCIPLVFAGISYLITGNPNAYLDVFNEALKLDQVPAYIHSGIGIGIGIYGFILSFWEKYTGKSLFYVVGKDWGQGNYVVNSGLILIISALCFVPSFPIKGILGIIICVLIVSGANAVLRIIMNLLQSRKETRLLWEVGTADTEITWKGKGYLCGQHMKVRVQGSEQGKKIPVGASVMVVKMEGFTPVVEQV